MSEPFNLDAALGDPFRFTFCGEEYSLPPDITWAAGDLLSDGKIQEGIRELLGEDQWARLQEAPQPFGTRSFTAVLTAYNAHLGLDSGESEASSPSSADTVGQSRRTSSASTAPTSAGSLTVLTG